MQRTFLGPLFVLNNILPEGGLFSIHYTFVLCVCVCKRFFPTMSIGNWQNIASLREGFRYIYQSEKCTDCEFHVGDGATFKAHRLVLSARSPVFAKLLMDKPAYDNLVDDKSITEKGFRILLKFIYTDEIGTEDKSSIVEAFTAANYYQQPALKAKCEEMINSWDISEDEVCNLLNVSRTVPVLLERCLRYIKNNAVRVISSDGFLDLNMDSLKLLLEDYVLKDVPLMLRIERIMKWGELRYETKHAPQPVNYAKIREDFMSCKPPLLKMIGLEELGLDRFNRLFAVRGSYNGLITTTERVQFMDYFEQHDRIYLPDWMN